MDDVPADPERDPLALDGEYNEDREHTIYCCQVCDLLMLGFYNHTDKDRAEILQKGRPTPMMSSMVLDTGRGHVRHFHPHTYKTYDWLTGCDRRSKVFCWPCLLFSTSSNIWRSTGISDLNNLHNVMKRHANSQGHIESALKLKIHGKIGPTINESRIDLERTRRSFEQEVIKNRDILKKHIRLLCFLSNHELSHCLVDPKNPIDESKYLDYVKFIAKFDETLKGKLNNDDLSFSSTIRNNLILSINCVIYKLIKAEITESKFFSIIVNGVSELGETILIYTIVRFVSKEGYVRERFLNFQEISSPRSADSVFEAVNSNLKFLNCPMKVVSQSYDGGVVKTSELDKLQTKVKDNFPNALFLHYYNHKLSSILAQSLSTIKECKQFFFTLNSMSAAFSKSKKLSEELKLYISRSKANAPDFNWDFDGHFIRNLLEIRAPLIQLFESIVKTEDGWDFETVFVSAGYLTVLSSDITFNMLLIFLGEIFLLADEISDLFKTITSNVDECIEKANEFVSSIKRKKDSFFLLFEETSRLLDNVDEPPIKIKKSSENNFDCSNQPYRTLYETVLTNIVDQLTARFNDLPKLKFLDLANFKSSRGIRGNPEGLLHCLRNKFQLSFDFATLCSELNVLLDSKFINRATPREMLKYLRTMNLQSTLPQTVKFCELAIILPVSKGNSTFDRTQDYIKNSSIGHKLSPFPIISIEKEMVDTLLEEPSFYEEVIEEFSKKEPSIRLHYTT